VTHRGFEPIPLAVAWGRTASLALMAMLLTATTAGAASIVHGFDRHLVGPDRISAIDPITGQVSGARSLTTTVTIAGTSGPVIVTSNVTAAFSGFVAIASGPGGAGGGSAVSEPASMLLFGFGVAALSVSRRRGAARPALSHPGADPASASIGGVR